MLQAFILLAACDVQQSCRYWADWSGWSTAFLHKQVSRNCTVHCTRQWHNSASSSIHSLSTALVSMLLVVICEVYPCLIVVTMYVGTETTLEASKDNNF